MFNIEFNIQKQIFEWANLNIKKYPELRLLNSSLNGVKLTSKIAGKKAKLSGMKKGYPDLFLPIAKKDFHGLFIELKRDENKALNIKKGVLSKEQKQWINDLNKQGYLAVVCYGFENTKNVILNYLHETQTRADMRS